MLKTVAITSGGGGGNGTVTQVNTGTGLIGGPITTTGTVSLANTTVAAGSYSLANITVDAQGRITAAANGVGAYVTSVGATSPVASSGGLTPVISMPAANSTTNGYLTSTDWSTFNSKGSGNGSVTQVNTGTGLTGGPITTTGTVSLANTAVTAASYGNATAVATFTVNGQGQLTAAANVSILLPNSGLVNSSVTIGNTSVALGATATTFGNVVLQNANITSVAATFPNSYLANSSATLGNATVTLGSTTTTVGNLTLQNANITSVAATFPNSYLTNSAVTIGNTSVSLGGTATSFGNVTLTNATFSSGNITATNVSASNVTVTANLYANLTTNANATFATSSLPLVPEGYVVIVINGTQKKIPYYGM